MTSVNDALFGPANRFSAFLASTNQKANITEHMTTIFNELGGLIARGPLTFIDVGCGEGELTIPVYKTLLGHNPQITLVGIDPSKTMTEALTTQLKTNGFQGHVITDLFFDHPSGDVPSSIKEAGKGDIVLCSHIVYYAKDIDAATDQIFGQVAPDGILISVHQSKESQMHQLRNKFSIVSIRAQDGEPITADHMEARLTKVLPPTTTIAHFDFTSDLYFSDDTPAFINDLTALLEQGVEVSKFQALVDKYENTAITGRNVLEFILREDLFEIEKERAIAFLKDVSSLLQQNSRAENGKLRIVISESISFASPSAQKQAELAELSARYKERALGLN